MRFGLGIIHLLRSATRFCCAPPPDLGVLDGLSVHDDLPRSQPAI